MFLVWQDSDLKELEGHNGAPQLTCHFVRKRVGVTNV